MTQQKAGDRLTGLSTRLGVLFLAMVIAGFVIPSPGVGAGVPHAPAPAPQQASPYRPLARPARPLTLVVPAIGLRAPIVPIEIDPRGVLTPPANVHEVGWWRRSARPGSATGQTLVTGHTVHTGGGVMNRLGSLKPGAIIRIETRIGTVHYRATKVFVYTKRQLAQHAAELFGQDEQHGRLVLVTCTGWTGHDYTSNIIVYGDQLGVPVATAPVTKAG